MAYLPKSKVNIKEASQGEFIFKKNKKPFEGKYLELSNRKYYAGTNTINLGSELIKAVEESSNNEMGSSFDVKKYSILDPKKKKFLKNTKTIPVNKTQPTEQDYQRGYYTRFFARKVNQPKGYIEINFDTVKKLQEKVEYDFNLYEVGSLTWALKNGTRKTNNNNLRTLEQTFPYISSLFTILNEFEVIDGPLTTTGGELYYENGVEYTGPYHIHPEKGPMVGAQHVPEPHSLLRFSEDLKSPADNIEEAIPRTPPTDVNYGDFKKSQQKQAKTSKMSRVSSVQRNTPTPTRGSSTGGGGY